MATAIELQAVQPRPRAHQHVPNLRRDAERRGRGNLQIRHRELGDEKLGDQPEGRSELLEEGVPAE